MAALIPATPSAAGIERWRGRCAPTVYIAAASATVAARGLAAMPAMCAARLASTTASTATGQRRRTASGRPASRARATPAAKAPRAPVSGWCTAVPTQARVTAAQRTASIACSSRRGRARWALMAASLPRVSRGRIRPWASSLRRMRLQPEHAQRRQGHRRAEGLAVPGVRLGDHALPVAHVGAAVDVGVAVEQLAPAPAERKADAEALVHHRREVGDADHPGEAVRVVADEADHVLVGVARVDPAEALGRHVALEERVLLAVDEVEVANQALDALVGGMLQQVPVDGAVVRPLLGLGDLAAHEEELLAGVGPHPGEERAQVGAALPAV